MDKSINIKEFNKCKYHDGCVKCSQDISLEEVMPFYKCRICENYLCDDCYRTTNDFVSEDTCSYCLMRIFLNLQEKYKISKEDMDYLDYVLHM